MTKPYYSLFISIAICLFSKAGNGQSNWLQVSSGKEHSLGIKSDGSLWGWGANYYYHLGDGTRIDKSTPTHLFAGTLWKKISAGDDHSVAIRSDGTLWAAGNNTNGQVTGNFSLQSLTQIDTSKRWVDVSTGEDFTIALKANGELWACGDNTYGQLAGGQKIIRNATLFKTGITNLAKIHAGTYHCLGIKKDGTLWAWGRNYFGALGLENPSDRVDPVQIGTENMWVEISAGHEFSLGIKKDGTLWAWGYNAEGQLGSGDTKARFTPTLISSEKWKEISAGFGYATAIKLDGTLWMWGNSTLLPKQVTTDKTWEKVSSAPFHRLGIRRDQKNFCAQGSNAYGQLGNGTTTDMADWSCDGIITSVEFQNKKDLYQVFPNPNRGSFSFRTEQPGYYYVVNEMGQTVKGFSINSSSGNTVEIDNLEAGVYIIQEKSLTHSMRIVVIK